MKDRLFEHQQTIAELKSSLYNLISNYSTEPVSYDGCDTLYIFTMPGFLGENKNEDLSWWVFLALRREAPVSTRSKTAARYHNKYFIPWSQYSQNAVNIDYFRRVVFVYLSKKTSDNESERLWLKDKAEQGCMILTNHPICFKGKPGMDLFEKNSFYLPVLNLLETVLDINLDQYYELLSFSNMYSRLQFYGNIGLQRSEYIYTRLNSMTGNINTVTQFYNLIKICEYCIHMQALKSLCTNSQSEEADSRKLLNPSLGTMNRLQNINDIYTDPDLANDARKLDMNLSGKGRSNIHKTRVSYREICELIVRLRNRYLGHGVMTEKLTFDMIGSLNRIMYKIVTTFVQSERLEDNDCLPSPIDREPVPAIMKYKKETYYFCGYYFDKNKWYADYLCFKLGLSVRYDLEDMKNPVLISESTSVLDTETMNAPGFTIHTELDEGERKSIGSFTKDIKYRSLIYDDLSEDKDSLWGTKSFSDSSLNVRAMYSYADISKMNHEELHRMYLKEPHPVYLLQVSKEGLEKFTWTEESFGEKAFLDTVENGFLIPNCRNVMALIGTDPKRVRHPYPWIKNTEVIGFKNMQEYEYWKASVSASMMFQLINEMQRKAMDSASEKSKAAAISINEFIYTKQSEFYLDLLRSFEYKSILRNSYNVYFAGMMKNALDAPNLEFSFIGLFDFLEFAMYALYCWASSKYDVMLEHPFRLSNINNAAEVLVRFGEEYHEPRFENLRKMRIPVNGKLRKLHQDCTRFLPVRLEGDEIDFLTACRILRYLRNRTKGHGFIQPFNCGVLWELTMHYAMAVIRFLDLASFDMEIVNGILYGSYEGDQKMYQMIYYYFQDNMPCPVIDADQSMIKCMNYFTGETFTVEIPKEE